MISAAMRKGEKMSDPIERQAAIDAINTHFGFNIEEEYGSAVQEVINGLPSATQWIPCSKRLPENHDWVLGIFQEGDTGWINPIPFICDYIGKKTPITTQDNWLLKMVDEPHPYYKKLYCVAWMPLPKPWREK